MYLNAAYAEMRCEQLRAKHYPGGPGKYVDAKIVSYSSPEGKRMTRALLSGNLALLVALAVSLLAFGG